MNVAGWIAIGIMVLAAVLITVRAVRPGRLGDRAVALDAITAIITSTLVVAAGLDDDGLLLEVALVLGLLGFLASVTVARFIERRGS